MPSKKAKKARASNGNSNRTLIGLGLVAIICVVLFLGWRNTLSTQPPQYYPTGTFTQTTQTMQTYTYNTYTYDTYQNERAPTTMTALVSPSVIQMNGWVAGTVSSNGYNYPLTIYAKHKGSGQTQQLAALLGPDGKYTVAQQITVPGRWEFWAVAGSVTSNTIQLTVEGVKVVGESNHYSKTLRTSMTLQIYSHLTGNAAIILNDPAHSVSYPLTNAYINTGGYGEISITLNGYANGDYEIDAIINGVKASSYTYGSYWVSIGR